MKKKTLSAGNMLDITFLDERTEEQFRTILKSRDVEIEQIVSFGRITPEGEWYDQDWDEWIMVVQGTAEITFADGDTEGLSQGGHLLLKKHVRHRVSYTSEDCIWLAVHIKA